MPLICYKLWLNTLIISWILLENFVNIVNGSYVTPIIRNSDICGGSNGRRMYLEVGDHGSLKVANASATVSKYYNKFYNQQKSVDHPLPMQYQCSIELVTCPSCVINITITYLNFSNYCPEMVGNQNLTDPCKCEKVLFWEPPYDANFYGKIYCGKQTEYVSRTRSLSIKFLYYKKRLNVLKLDYKVQSNQNAIIGQPRTGIVGKKSKSNNLQTIESPFFPALYPRDIAIEHLITCESNMTKDCRIQVLFTDFQIAMVSSMEFYDTNDQQMDVYTGVDFRPPLLISSGSSMLIKFYANGGTGLGYRAKVSFLTITESSDDNHRPYTDCGGYVESLGGAITMMNMVDNETIPKLYDCFWLIRPPDSYLHLKTHMSLRVDIFQNLFPGSVLTIRKGMTSDRPIMDVIKAPFGSQSTVKNYVVPLKVGFYVSLQGLFTANSKLALVYTAFSFLDCYIGSEFLCQNRKCIPIQLQCDGFDHCGDNSDEPESCLEEWRQQPVNRRWYSHTSNFYFPKSDRYPDYKTATLVFTASTLGLIFLLSAIIVLVYKLGNRVRQQRELQSQLQTISELLDNSSRQDETPPEEPPAYEAPPDYDEIIKLGFDDEGNRISRRQSRDYYLSRSRRTSRSYQNSILEVVLPPETTQNNRRSSVTTNLLLIEQENDIGRVSQLDSYSDVSGPSSFSHKSCQANLIPDSPPPIYRVHQSVSTSTNSSTSAREMNNILAVPSTSNIQLNGEITEDLIDMQASNCGTSSTNSCENFLSTSDNFDWQNITQDQRGWLDLEGDNELKNLNLELQSKPTLKQELNSTNSIGTVQSDIRNDEYMEHQIDLESRLMVENNVSISTDSNECKICGGAILRRSSIDDNMLSCFGPINLFGHLRNTRSSVKYDLLCRCDNIPTIPLLDELTQSPYYRNRLPLRRSSSAEQLFALKSIRQQMVTINKSASNLTGLNL